MLTHKKTNFFQRFFAKRKDPNPAKEKKGKIIRKGRSKIRSAKLTVEISRETGELAAVLTVEREQNKGKKCRMEIFYDMMPEILDAYLKPFTLNEIQEIRKMITDQVGQMSHNIRDMPEEFMHVLADLENIEKQKTSEAVGWLMKNVTVSI